MLLYCIQESKQCDEKVANSRPSPLSVKMTAGVKRKSTDKANADNGAPNLVKVLELTEQELFDCKVQLNAKVHIFPKLVIFGLLKQFFAAIIVLQNFAHAQ